MRISEELKKTLDTIVQFIPLDFQKTIQASNTFVKMVGLIEKVRILESENARMTKEINEMDSELQKLGG